jgi:uncharacterized membrane protein YhiD involved in acid resistance
MTAVANSGSASGLVREARSWLARLIWIFCAVGAICLALGALLIVLSANEANSLVKLVLHLADFFDLGVFSRDDGIKQFTGAHHEVKNALFNWGIGAIAWLIVGRIVERIVKP